MSGYIEEPGGQKEIPIAARLHLWHLFGMPKTVLTYGTFDLFHIGHLNLLERAAELGDRLIVAVSTDEFNAGKGKKSIIPFEHRSRIVAAMKCVDLVIPELTWDQKEQDVKTHAVDVFVMGDDWEGKFDFLKPHCEVTYLSRTADVSSTEVKGELSSQQLERLDRVTGEHS